MRQANSELRHRLSIELMVDGEPWLTWLTWLTWLIRPGGPVG